LNGADFFFFSKHVLSPESPGNRPHPPGEGLDKPARRVSQLHWGISECHHSGTQHQSLSDHTEVTFSCFTT
ncbi:hypothetical protein, partial [Escherichia coli]|uniref:hypothetical protein n=1 Tax=Escherichia coli TaxID=562 RepID=UPI001BC8A4B0